MLSPRATHHSVPTTRRGPKSNSGAVASATATGWQCSACAITSSSWVAANGGRIVACQEPEGAGSARARMCPPAASRTNASASRASSAAAPNDMLPPPTATFTPRNLSPPTPSRRNHVASATIAPSASTGSNRARRARHRANLAVPCRAADCCPHAAAISLTRCA